MENLTEFWEALIIILAMVAPVIGVTGGFKGLFEWALGGLPDLHLGPWTIKDGVYLSWGIAAVLVVIGNASGWFADVPILTQHPTAWLGFQWTTLALVANIVRNAAGLGGAE